MTRNYNYFSTVLRKISLLVIPCIFTDTHVLQITCSTWMNRRKCRRKSSFVGLVLPNLNPGMHDIICKKNIKLIPLYFYLVYQFIDSHHRVIQFVEHAKNQAQSLYDDVVNVVRRETTTSNLSWGVCVWMCVSEWVCEGAWSFLERGHQSRSLFF